MSYELPACLEIRYELLEHLNQNLFDFARHHLARTVLLANIFKFVVVFQEELQILERHVDVQVGSLLSLLLQSWLAAAKGILIDFLLDIISTVSQQYSTCRVTRRHLSLLALQCWEESAVDASGLCVF